MKISAQEGEGNRKYLDQSTGNLLYLYQYTDIQGTPFLHDDWINGKVILIDNSYVTPLQLKFDIYNNKFLFNRHDTALQVPSTVKTVYLFNSPDTSNAEIFKKGFSINNKINAATYLQVLTEGKIILLKYYIKNMEEYTEYGDATKHKRFADMQQYYILQNEQYKVVTLSKQNLQDLLSDKWSQVSQFLTQKNLNGKDEKSWSQAIHYYNLL